MKLHPLLLCSLALLCLAAPARAVLLQPSFETGDFTGFATYGNASIVTASYGTAPMHGSYMALLQTGAGSLTATQIFDAFGFAPIMREAALAGLPEDSAASAIISLDYTSDAWDLAAKALINGGNPFPHSPLDSIVWVFGVQTNGLGGMSSVYATVDSAQPSSTPFLFEGAWGGGGTEGGQPMRYGAIILQRPGDFSAAGAGVLLDRWNIASVPDSSSTLGLLATACAGLLALRHRRAQV